MLEAVARYPREDMDDSPVARIDLLEPKGFKVYFANPEGLKTVIFNLRISKVTNGMEGAIQFTISHRTDWEYINKEYEFSSGDLIRYTYNITYDNGTEHYKDTRICPITLPVTHAPNAARPTCVQRNGTVTRIYIAGVNTTVNPDEYYFFKSNAEKG